MKKNFRKKFVWFQRHQVCWRHKCNNEIIYEWNIWLKFNLFELALLERAHVCLLTRYTWMQLTVQKTNKQKLFISFSRIFTEYVERHCDADGNWAIRENSTHSQYPNGWTNFTPCYTDDMKKLLDKLGSEDAAQVSFLCFLIGTNVIIIGRKKISMNLKVT